MSRLHVLFMLSGLLLSSCIAVDSTSRAASGIVVDAASGKAIPGVSVFRQISDKSKLVATTDTGGRFAVTASHTVYVTIPMGDAFYPCRLIFKAPGYQEQQIDCGTGTGASHTESMPSLTVKLHKRPNQAMKRIAAGQKIT